MKFLIKIVTVFLILATIFSCHQKSAVPRNRMGIASRENKNGWIYIHLSGSPSNIGYQHGYLVAKEIDTLIKEMQCYLPVSSGNDWAFYRKASARFLWNKIDKEYQDEIKGIAEGLQAKGLKYDSLDVIALNANIELSAYYVSRLMKKVKPGNPGDCSAFIATGSFTKDHKIVMGRNTWTDYIAGKRWNVIADIKPEKGNQILMDCAPGFIHSGDDFVISKSGVLITETIINGFKDFDTTRSPEFMRARKAAQYSNNIDDVVKIMTTDNRGGYENDCLIGDTKTNEVAKLELRLKNYRVWRSKDTAMIGSNFLIASKPVKKETVFGANNKTYPPIAGGIKMEKPVAIDDKGKQGDVAGIDSSTYGALNGENHYILDGHVDQYPFGCRQFSIAPYLPVQGKITTTDLAQKMELWAHMGHLGDGDADVLAESFVKKHPEQFNKQSIYVSNMEVYPWTLFAAK